MQEENASFIVGTNSVTRLTIASTGAATFSSSVSVNGNISIGSSGTNDITWGTAGGIKLSRTNVGPEYALSQRWTGTLAYIDIASSTQWNGGVTILPNGGGNVGIGTSSPNYQLELGGTSPKLSLASSSATGYNEIYFHRNTSTIIGYIASGVNETVTSNGDALVLDNRTSGGNIVFRTNNSGTVAERMRITSGGNVGINTSGTVYNGNSGKFLSIVDTGDTYFEMATSSTSDGVGGAITWNNTNKTGTDKRIAQMAGFRDGANDTGSIVFTTCNAGSFTEKLRITAGGEVRVGSTDNGAYNLQCNGTGVWGAGAYVNGSDIALKENILDIEKALDLVLNLKPKSFTYKEDYSKDQSIQTGFIAQDLLETLKDQIYVDGIVSKGKNHLNVAYQNLIPLLTKAIQEQQLQIELLKSKLN
jgi:hypothetical protein